MTPEAQKYLGNILKTALIFTLIGAGLAFLGPYIAAAAGASVTSFAVPMAKILEQGIFFGLFGGASATITPLVDSVISAFSSRNSSPAHIQDAVGITLAQAQGVEQAATHGMPDPSAGHAAGHAGLVDKPQRAAQFADKLNQMRALEAAQPGINRIQ